METVYLVVVVYSQERSRKIARVLSFLKVISIRLERTYLSLTNLISYVYTGSCLYFNIFTSYVIKLVTWISYEYYCIINYNIAQLTHPALLLLCEFFYFPKIFEWFHNTWICIYVYICVNRWYFPRFSILKYFIPWNLINSEIWFYG